VKIRTDIQQGSLEWLAARAGIPTASEFDQLLTPEFEIRKGQMPATYLARKVAEKWLGGPLPGFSSLDMEFGKILEEEAIPWYELEFGETIQRVGLVTTDDGRVGCSPDGLIGEDGGIEVKCPEPTAHVKYLLDGDVPKDYRAQVHGAMFVTGRAWWKFVSYRRHFPPVVLTVFRDDDIQAKIAEAVEAFLPRLDRAMERLGAMNGEPRARKEAGV
jgi:hypothetical protein